jgi:hypothetical protein
VSGRNLQSTGSAWRLRRLNKFSRIYIISRCFLLDALLSLFVDVFVVLENVNPMGIFAGLEN